MFSFFKTSQYTTNTSITIYALFSNFWISRFTRSFAPPRPAPRIFVPAPLEKAPPRTSLQDTDSSCENARPPTQWMKHHCQVRSNSSNAVAQGPHLQQGSQQLLSGPTNYVAGPGRRSSDHGSLNLEGRTKPTLPNMILKIFPFMLMQVRAFAKAKFE